MCPETCVCVGVPTPFSQVRPQQALSLSHLGEVSDKKGGHCEGPGEQSRSVTQRHSSATRKAQNLGIAEVSIQPKPGART